MVSHRSIYLPSMSYSLPSTSFTSELATIQSTDKSTHVAMGFNRNMPLEVVRPNIHRRSRACGICMSNKAAKDLCVATTHPAERSPRTNDVDRTPVDASGVGFAIPSPNLRLLPHAGHWLPSLREFLARVYDRDRNTYWYAPDGSMTDPHGGR
jgi:hypothetical protein